MSKKTTDTRSRVWSYPTCSINGFGLLEQGHTYDLTRVPEGVRDHPAWVEPDPTPVHTPSTSKERDLE